MSTPALWRLLDEATNVAEQQLCHASASAPRQHARAILASFQQNGTCNASSHWRRMGHSAQVPQQVETLANLVRGEAGPKVCCEVGFNAGHSALVWLEGGCQRLIEFDRPARALLGDLAGLRREDLPRAGNLRAWLVDVLAR